MSHSSQSGSSTSPSNVVDPLDLFDFSEYDNMSYNSPSVSPTTTNKAQFVTRPSSVMQTPSTLPSNQALNGPSHQYDQYKQQTPFVPGALASTMAVNQTNPHAGYTLEFNEVTPSNDMSFDFNSMSSQVPDMDVEFESPAEASFFFPEMTNTVNPTVIGGQDALTSPASTGNAGRMYPGMHQQAALAKAQAQQRQQQQIIAQQQQQQRQGSQAKQQRPKSAQPSDPIVEQKISQLLNSMRQKPSIDSQDDSPMMHLPRLKKDEDDMDDDERLLASEEGKKLSSKERRQLRNKVSARAFRSRRKEYITQLEAEIATKVTENGDLRSQNRALIEENRRLSDLTRMLLSSSSFSNFLDHLSSNPAAVPQTQQQQAAPQVEQRQTEARQMPKDVNPYSAAQQAQQQQIGMVMIPEQAMEFSMLNLDSDAFNYQPRVYVCETPEIPEIDVSALSGKTSDFVGPVSDLADEKVEIAAIESPVRKDVEQPKTAEEPVATAKAPADLNGDIFDDEVAAPCAPVEDAVFGGIKTEKALARYELVDAAENDAAADIAFSRIELISASLDASIASLERLGLDL